MNALVSGYVEFIKKSMKRYDSMLGNKKSLTLYSILRRIEKDSNISSASVKSSILSLRLALTGNWQNSWWKNGFFDDFANVIYAHAMAYREIQKGVVQVDKSFVELSKTFDTGFTFDGCSVKAPNLMKMHDLLFLYDGCFFFYDSKVMTQVYPYDKDNADLFSVMFNDTGEVTTCLSECNCSSCSCFVPSLTPSKGSKIVNQNCPIERVVDCEKYSNSIKPNPVDAVRCADFVAYCLLNCFDSCDIQLVNNEDSTRTFVFTNKTESICSVETVVKDESADESVEYVETVVKVEEVECKFVPINRRFANKLGRC